MDIVGLTGYAQHGKDTAGAVLVEQLGYRRFALADGVRLAALAIDPLVALKPMGKGYAPNVLRLSTVVMAYGWDAAKADPEVRRLLQVIGTEAGRDIHGEDVWVNACERRIRESGAERVVITDVRFPNEAAWVKRLGGVVARVTRPGFDNGVDPTHASEAHIATLPADVELRNAGSLEAFCSAVAATFAAHHAARELRGYGESAPEDAAPDTTAYGQAWEDFVKGSTPTERFRFRRLDKVDPEEHLS